MIVNQSFGIIKQKRVDVFLDEGDKDDDILITQSQTNELNINGKMTTAHAVM